VAQPASDPRWSPQYDQRTGFRTRNILAAPLVSVHDDRLVGVLQLLNKHEGSFDRFDQKLLEAFSSHAAAALERARLIEESETKKRLEISLSVAHDIQASFMPRELPKVSGYDLAGWWEPAEEASGDYYDVLNLPDGRVGLVMADVAGHGIGPSLIMASMRAALHALVLEHSQPEDLLRQLSQTVLRDLHGGRFITCFLGALDGRYHFLRYANAGHGPALHFRPRTGNFRDLEGTGLPLGVFGAPPPKGGPVIRLEPGDLIVLATDGLVETCDAGRQLFGNERLKQFLKRHHDLPCRELVERLGEAAAEFRGQPRPIDDVTMLVLRRLPT
jgi:serine phosphatase RsbU (regulator of sigma subunit)